MTADRLPDSHPKESYRLLAEIERSREPEQREFLIRRLLKHIRRGFDLLEIIHE